MCWTADPLGPTQTTELIDQLKVAISASTLDFPVSLAQKPALIWFEVCINHRFRPMFESLCVFTIHYSLFNIRYSLYIITTVSKYCTSYTYLPLQSVCYTPPEASQITYFMSVVRNIAGNITVRQTVYYIGGLASILHRTCIYRYNYNVIILFTDFECS